MQHIWNHLVNCESRSKNFTWIGILLAGPTLDMDESLEPYYEYYSKEPITDSISLRKAIIHVHLQFMRQVIQQFDQCKKLNSMAWQISNLALQWQEQTTTAITCTVKFKGSALDFVMHFFKQFNIFLTSVLNQSGPMSMRRRFTLTKGGRHSLLLLQLKDVAEFKNPVAESIPNSGLWCSGHLNSFHEWLKDMDRQDWFVDGSYSDTDIRNEIQRTKDLILTYYYREFLHLVCQNYHLQQCPALLESSDKHFELHINLPLHERLDALQEFQFIVMSRLHQLEEEAKAMHVPLESYLSELYDRGKPMHQETTLTCESQDTKCWKNLLRKNRLLLKQLQAPHFVYDFETQLTSKNPWHIF